MTGPPDRPWLPFPAGDAFARAAVPVCQRYNEVLASTDVRASASRLHVRLEAPRSPSPGDVPAAADGATAARLRLLAGRTVGPELVVLTLPDHVAELGEAGLARLAAEAVHSVAAQVLVPGQDPGALDAAFRSALGAAPAPVEEPAVVLEVLPPRPALRGAPMVGIVFAGRVELGRWPAAAPWRREVDRLMRRVVGSEEWQDWWRQATVPTLELSWEFEPRLSKDVKVHSVRRGKNVVTARVARTVFTLERDGEDGAVLARADVRALLQLVAARVGLPEPPPLR